MTKTNSTFIPSPRVKGKAKGASLSIGHDALKALLKSVQFFVDTDNVNKYLGQGIRRELRQEYTQKLYGRPQTVIRNQSGSIKFQYDRTGDLRKGVSFKAKDGRLVIFNKAPHAHLLELGYTKRGGNGFVKPRPVMGPYFARLTSSFMPRLRDAYVKELKREGII